MLFLGSTFVGAQHTLDSSSASIGVIHSTIVQNGIFDDLYAENTLMSDWNGETEFSWGYDTAFHAKFEENLYAGNVDFSLRTVDTIRIKRRKKGELIYQTIRAIPVDKVEDLQFEWHDYTAGAGEYEYALIPSLNGIEGTINSNTVESKFDGVFLVDAASHFHMYLDLDLSYHRTKPGQSLTTLGTKYAHYVSNGNANYTVGSIKGLVVQETENCDWDFENGWRYRERFDDFLTNGAPKIIKNEDGEIWLASILTDTISEDHSNSSYKVDTSFDWQECGDVNDVKELYKAALINTLDGNTSTISIF